MWNSGTLRKIQKRFIKIPVSFLLNTWDISILVTCAGLKSKTLPGPSPMNFDFCSPGPYSYGPVIREHNFEISRNLLIFVGAAYTLMRFIYSKFRIIYEINDNEQFNYELFDFWRFETSCCCKEKDRIWPRISNNFQQLHLF